MPQTKKTPARAGASKNQNQDTAVSPWKITNRALEIDFAKPVPPKEMREKDKAGRAKRPPRDDTKYIAKGIIVSLSNHASVQAHDVGSCHVKVKRIAREAQCDPRTCRMHLRALEQAGFLTSAHQDWDNGRQRENTYVLHFEAWDAEMVGRFHVALRKLRAGGTHTSHPEGDSNESPRGGLDGAIPRGTQASHPERDSIESPHGTTKRNDPDPNFLSNFFQEYPGLREVETSMRKKADGPNRAIASRRTIAPDPVPPSRSPVLNGPSGGDSRESSTPNIFIELERNRAA